MPASKRTLDAHGIIDPGELHWNLGTAALYEQTLRRSEGLAAEYGPLVCLTGVHTGRSPNDKFLVQESSSEGNVWWGKVNRPMVAGHYEALKQQMLASLRGKELFVQDCFAGADSEYRLPVRIITECAWHSLFARTMFLPGPAGAIAPDHQPQFTVINVPYMEADPEKHGTN